MVIDPEIGFTSDVIKDPNRFVGRTQAIRDCIAALNTPTGLIAIYGRRGLGKSSLLRQVQKMALGDYTLVKQAGLHQELPTRMRKYLTVLYTCDATIKSAEDLLSRLCNDNDEEDGLLRLVPNEGKEIVEFTRSKEVSASADLKVAQWGAKGTESSKYARVVPGDIIQTFRNFVQSVVATQVEKRMKRDGLLILLDEFDVIRDKTSLGSLIKSLSTDKVKFGICGIGQDLNALVSDHKSVERLVESGAIRVGQMEEPESEEIIETAERLFNGALGFDDSIKREIAKLSEGYPYFTQLIGRACVDSANRLRVTRVTREVFNDVLAQIKNGRAFPTLEQSYQRAIGQSQEREYLLHLLAGQDNESVEMNDAVGAILLKDARNDARDLDIDFVDQNLPRLVDEKYGGVLRKVPERRGVYEFESPIFRLYVKLRKTG